MCDSPETHLFCHRCGCHLQPGKSGFYVVRIEAFADPTPEDIQAGDVEGDPGEQIDRLISEMQHMSEQELMDQIHQRLTIHLCRACYTVWIEEPAGHA